MEVGPRTALGEASETRLAHPRPAGEDGASASRRSLLHSGLRPRPLLEQPQDRAHGIPNPRAVTRVGKAGRPDTRGPTATQTGHASVVA